MIKKFLKLSLFLTIVFGLIFGFIAFRDYKMTEFFKNFKQPAASVSVAKAKATNWNKQIEAVGTIVAVKGVEVSAQTAGMVKQIYFQSGSTATENMVLFQLDDQADRDDLKSSSAQLDLAKLNFMKSETLYKKQALAEINYQEALTKLKTLEAEVGKTKTIIEYKKIKAPFAGKLGIKQVNIGDYINPGEALVSLQMLDPLYVHFNLPEQALNTIKLNQLIKVKVDVYPDINFSGTITAINAHVDIKTRNILVEGIINNKNNKLFPGMFANVQIITGISKNIITVPETAISYNLYGDSVFVVKEKNNTKQVERRYVKTGERRDGQVAIIKGLKAGETVVISGQLKLDNNTPVKVVKD